MGLSAVQLLRVGGDAIPPLQPQAVDRRLRIRRFQVRRRHLNALPLKVRPLSKVSPVKENHSQIKEMREETFHFLPVTMKLLAELKRLTRLLGDTLGLVQGHLESCDKESGMKLPLV